MRLVRRGGEDKMKLYHTGELEIRNPDLYRGRK